MITEKFKSKGTLLLAAGGLVVATLSLLETRIEWLAELCGLFGGGCTEAKTYTLLTIPVAAWGVAYYLVLLGILTPALFLNKPNKPAPQKRKKKAAEPESADPIRPMIERWRLRMIMIGFGVELTFLQFMIAERFLCLFCILNAAVQVGLFLLVLDRKRAWEVPAVCLLAFVISNHILSSENLKRPASAAACAKGPSEAAARVGDETITYQDFISPIATRIYKMEQEIYRLKKETLEQFIDQRLLELDAEKRGIDPAQLLRSLLTETDAASGRSNDRYRPPPQAQRVEKIIKEYTAPLRKTYPVQTFLELPPMPLTNVTPGNSPSMGPRDAAVTVIEFSDYLCPACRKGHSTVKKIRDSYKDKIRWVFKDFPLSRHRGAKKMAAAARCAHEQGKFWEYQDLLFSADGKPTNEMLRSFAQKLGLDENQFNLCLSNDGHVRSINAEKARAKNSGISSTPTLVINGRLRTGVPSYDFLKKTIDAALEAASR